MCSFTSSRLHCIANSTECKCLMQETGTCITLNARVTPESVFTIHKAFLRKFLSHIRTAKKRRRAKTMMMMDQYIFCRFSVLVLFVRQVKNDVLLLSCEIEVDSWTEQLRPTLRRSFKSWRLYVLCEDDRRIGVLLKWQHKMGTKSSLKAGISLRR